MESVIAEMSNSPEKPSVSYAGQRSITPSHPPRVANGSLEDDFEMAKYCSNLLETVFEVVPGPGSAEQLLSAASSCTGWARDFLLDVGWLPARAQSLDPALIQVTPPVKSALIYLKMAQNVSTGLEII